MNTTIRSRVVRLLSLSALALSFAGCGPGKPAETEPIQHEGPEDEILTVSTSWEASEQGKGFRDAPSSISVFEIQRRTSLVLKRGQRTSNAQIAIEETFRMRDGTTFVCRAEGTVQATLAYARHGQDPAIEIDQPSVTLSRQCDKPGFPEPSVQVEASRARFMLRSEQLVGYDPPLEKRVFLPVE
jgi:hypothetical protein